MKYLIMILALSMFLLTGCETTGNKRQNGTNTQHVNAKLKNVTIHGALTIGGAAQDTKDASQEGLGKLKAEAAVKDSINGNEVKPPIL
jgi:outer membrane biogenesis lipoprotein LolB